MDSKGVDFTAIPQTAIRVLTSPAACFREMPKTGGFLEPLVFMVAMGVVGGIIQAVVALLHLQAVAAAAMGLSAIVVVPLMVAIFGFVGAAILFGVGKTMGSQENYETAYRCGAYLSALTPITALLGIIPYAGMAAGIALTTFFLVIAGVEVHKLPAQKAWLVFGIIGAVLLVMNISAQIAARKMAAQMKESGAQMREQAEAFKKGAEELQKQMKRN
jgi:hypothetical protein